MTAELIVAFETGPCHKGKSLDYSSLIFSKVAENIQKKSIYLECLSASDLAGLANLVFSFKFLKLMLTIRAPRACGLWKR